jgi:chromosome segregation ATPase
MARGDTAARNGWHHQAARLAVAHTTLGTTVVTAAEQARRRRSSLLYGSDIDATTEAREIELAGELEAARARIAGLEKRIAHETVTTRTLSEQLQTLAPQSEAAEKRVVELENELNSARDGFALQDASLQTSLDLALSENARLSQNAGKSDAERDEVRARCEYLASALAAAEAECGRLGGELNETAEKYRAETGSLAARLEATSLRAGNAEKLYADACERLAARIADNSLVERRLADATGACHAADRKLKQFEDLLRSKQRQVDDLAQSRSKLIEATNQLLQTVQSRDTALIRAEEKIKFLNDRIAQLEADAAGLRKAHEAGLQQQLERAGRAGDDREKMRRNWAELAHELARLVKKRRQFSEQARLRSSAKLLAGTIAF